MTPSRVPLVAALALALAAPAGAFAPAPVYRERPPRLPLAGAWQVRFANGVVESCEIRADGTASVTEPLRSSTGAARREAGALVLTFQDGRVERWAVRGGRVHVEHWFPASEFPTGTPVRGVARPR